MAELHNVTKRKRKELTEDQKRRRLEYGRKYYKENRTELLEYRRQYYRKNRDRILDKNKADAIRRKGNEPEKAPAFPQAESRDNYTVRDLSTNYDRPLIIEAIRKEQSQRTSNKEEAARWQSQP